MTGYVIEKNGFTKASVLIADVINEMIANGFTQEYPGSPFDPETAGDQFHVTLEASDTVDPLNDPDLVTAGTAQPWRIRFEAISKDLISVIAATPIQLPDDGTFAKETNTGGAFTDIIGSIGGIATAGTITAANLDAGFINRETRVGPNGNSYPMSYYLSISPRGVYLGVWEEAVTAESSNNFNWFLIQRPVNRDTGEVIITGKAPLWCVNYTNKKAYQFVVREIDINRPGLRRSGSINQEDSEAVLNLNSQVRLTEDGKYVVNFPSRLNTSRYRYPHELDMIGMTSADVVSQFADIEIEVYGENDGADPTPNPTPRTYHALHSTDSANTDMRVLVLKLGGGITV